MIGDHLVERKWLKQVERKGLKQVKRKWLKKDSWLLIKLSPSLGSINQVISSECQEWFFGEMSLLPSVGACRLL